MATVLEGDSLTKGRVKTIKSVIMIIPHRPPPSFLRAVIALGFSPVFSDELGNQVYLETNLGDILPTKNPIDGRNKFQEIKWERQLLQGPFFEISFKLELLNEYKVCFGAS